MLVYTKKRCYSIYEVIVQMETKDIILKLRTEKGLSQDEPAEKVYVTRQAARTGACVF